LMHTFKVWAPIPSKVEVQLGNQKLPMTTGPGGWWEASVPSVAPGADYALLLDGKGPFPDPRSPWQPAGVHGPSRLVDHSAFSWTDAGFQAPQFSSAIIYELHTGTFTPEGTFVAAIEKLNHLLELGVTHIELMPVAAFSGHHGWGYDGVSMFAPHDAYGEPSDLKRLVVACHSRGLAVLLDVVYNHLGPSGNYLAQYGPYFTSRYSTPWGSAVNYDDADSDEVRRFFCDNALMWLREYHFDGLRLDAIHAIFDNSAQPFLEQLAVEVKQLGDRLSRRLALIAESDLNAPRVVLAPDHGGMGLTPNGVTIFITPTTPSSRARQTGTTPTSGRLHILPRRFVRRSSATGATPSIGAVASDVRRWGCRVIASWFASRTMTRLVTARKASAAANS
jgi:maltooligosyltrehalose trehalohydrolase